jgi:hypothetical protein
VWTSILSLVGVALGGALTALTQRATQHAADRAEAHRLRAATSEARRDEQVRAIQEFIACAQGAERAAYRRPAAWGEDEDWTTKAGDGMEALWVAERGIALLCPETLHGPAQDYARALNQAVWREIGTAEVNEHLDVTKTAFMAAARAALSTLSAPPDRQG